MIASCRGYETMILAADRTPNWRIWLHVPTAKLHECVALSPNIDPNKLQISPTSWMAGKRMFSEGQAFKDRLFLAERSLGRTLRLGEFAAWAASVEWDIPSELASLADVSGRSGEPALAPDPNERLTLPEQVRILIQVMPEDRARARIEKAFRFRDVAYQPQFAVSYQDARIDWLTGVVVLRGLPRQPFTPTLTAAEFSRHFARAFAEAPQSAMPRQEPEEHLDTLENAGPDAEPETRPCERASSSATPHRFEHPLWEVGDILGWLMDRDPGNFGRFLTQDDFRSEYYVRVILKSGETSLSLNPRQELLHALQRGQLAAYRDGRRLDKIEWFSKNETDILNGIRGFVVERDEVLKIWPFINADAIAGERSGADDCPSAPVFTPGFRTNRAEDAERACEVFIDGMVERPQNKDTASEAARSHCGEALSRKAFERAWAKSAPAAWKHPGRPAGGNRSP